MGIGLRILLRKCSQRRQESAFQGSKVFDDQHQFEDLYTKAARDAKTDERLQQFGSLTAFRFEDQEWPLEPKSAFYDWLYLRALDENAHFAQELLAYAAFTDIMFNPKKSFNCQARSAALYVALSRRDLLEKALSSRQHYLELVTVPPGRVQGSLFDAAANRTKARTWTRPDES